MTQKQLGINYHYKYFPEKELVKEVLLKEQGFICCYCCQRIEFLNSHIEHLSPQSKTDAELSLDYHNILASCGNSSSQYHPNHCGNAKKDKLIKILPLQNNCEDCFIYTSSGKIKSNKNYINQQEIQETIDILNLNDEDVKAMRQTALDVLQGMTKEQAQQLGKICQQKNSRGYYRAFCVAVSYYLKKNYGV